MVGSLGVDPAVARSVIVTALQITPRLAVAATILIARVTERMEM
jgi:hypothetical protein